MMLMNLNALEKRKQILKLRDKVIQAERERISGKNTISVSEARKALRERLDEI